MDKQIRTARAITDVDEIHFLKHVCGEPVITQNLIDGLEADGVTPLKPGWFSVATVKDTVIISQDPLSLTKVNIDQSNMPIGTTAEPGDFNVEFDMPDLRENLMKWLDGNYDSGEQPLHIGNAKGYGFDFNAEIKDMVLAIRTKSGEWIIFPSIQGSVSMQYTDKVWRLHFAGTVLGATNELNNDVYVLSDTDCTGSGGGDDDPSGDPSGDA